MTLFQFVSKIKNRFWLQLVRKIRTKKYYPFIYRSYYHFKFSKIKQEINDTCYFSANPHPGAGIGHQLANWIAGYWFAKQFGLQFAHLPFSTSRWEEFLGFGENEKKVNELLKVGYKKRKLPLFNEDNKSEVDLIKSIINSYAGKKIVFVAEQDQFYMEQFGVIDDLKRKFNNAKSRTKDKIIYNSNNFNIAVHVRRTVIIGDKVILEDQASRSMRWLSNDYYEKVLKQVLQSIHINKPIDIYIFSTGKSEEFAEFSKYGNVNFCSNMDEYASFLHLIKADLLITSKSSFSYKPALMSEGIKICPRNFWHGYPENKNWILAENDGSFNINDLTRII